MRVNIKAMSLRYRLLLNYCSRCIAERIGSMGGGQHQIRSASRFPPEVVARIIKEKMIDEALFGPIINIKKESNTTKSSVSKQTKDSEGIKTNSNLKTKVTKVSTNSHQTSSVNNAKSTIAASANDTEGIKKNSNSKANAKVSSYSQQTSTENDTKSTIAVSKKKAAIKALNAVIGSEASSKTAGTRIKEEHTESKSSVKVPIKEGDKLCVKLEQNPHKVKTSDSKNDTVEKEIKKKPKVDAKLVKGLIHAAEVDKQKKEMLENLGTVVDRQSNALVLLANYGMYGVTNDSLTEKEQKYSEYINSFSLKNPPSVTKIISDTMSEKSRFFLERWKAQMIEEHGYEGFQIIQQETLANGRNLHTCIERFLDGESIENIIPWDDNKGHWDSLKSVLPSFSYVYGKEEMVVHNVLHYRGKFDCVAQYKDSICVIDWKTSKKPKPRLSDTFDHPLQLAAYAGALNQSQYLKDRKVDMIRNAVLVMCYPNGDPAHALFVNEANLNKYWKLWLRRLQQYWVQLSGKNK